MSIVLLGGIEVGNQSAARSLAEMGVKSISLIPAAAAFMGFQNRIDALEGYFSQAGIGVEVVPILTRSDAFDEGLVELVRQSSCPYLMDGSSLHLRGVVKESPLFDALAESASRDANLVASGASASVLGDPMVDPRGGAYTVGLGLVKKIAIFPHHNSAPPHLLARSTELISGPNVLVAIDDGTGLVQTGDHWAVIGDGNVTVFRGDNGPQVFSPGDQIQLP